MIALNPSLQTISKSLLLKGSRMKKILIAEDDPISARVYRTSLEKAGFEVQVAPDGQVAIEKIAESVPDAILLDLVMPRMTGIEVLKHLRSQPQFKSLPVMVYTNSPNLVQEATDAGATRVFDKAKLTPTILVEALNASSQAQGQASGS